MTLSVQANEGSSRQATVTVTSGSLTRTLNITQSAPVVAIRGTRVIECFGRRGYVNVSSTASAVPWNASERIAEMPIWDFVHIADNIFAIRNDTTRRYLTETSGGITHTSAISGSSRQHWRLIPQANGAFRIRSVSSETPNVSNALYIEDGNFNISLSSRSNNNSQLWWIEHIWHIDPNDEYENWFGVWDGRINILIETIGTPPATFNFESRMVAARNAWASALGITTLFRAVDNMEDANIRAYGGHREEIRNYLDQTETFNARNFRYGVTSIGGAIDPLNARVDEIRAGGATRTVNRLSGNGNNAVLMLVFSDNGVPHIHDPRNISFATMSAIHELGHALGYRGHSPNPNDVMLGIVPWHVTPNETLNPAEIEHLRQIYRMFRN